MSTKADKLKKKIADTKLQLARLEDEADGYPKRAAGLKIQNARKDYGLTQAELAEAVGISRTSLANIEGGKQSMTIKTLRPLCLELQLSADDLLEI